MLVDLAFCPPVYTGRKGSISARKKPLVSTKPRPCLFP